MLNKEKNNESYNKSNLYRNLASTSLNNRSVHSIEWRFRNISYVLDQNNHEWIPGLSPASGVGNHYEKILEYYNELSENISDDFIPLIPKESNKEAHIRKNAAITGKKAEEKFKQHAENILGWIVDDKTKEIGYGYDFECTDANGNKLYVEIKGCRENISDIRMTEKEWAVAEQKGDNYLLYIVWNLDDEPRFKKHINPYKKFIGKENPYESRIISIRIKKNYLS